MATKKFFKALRATAMAACLGSLGFAFVACEDEAPDYTSGPEAGVYYCEVDGEEHLITLGGGKTFALAVAEDNKSGIYTMVGDKLTLDFYADEDGVIEASLSEGVLTFTYGEQEMRFLKKVPYTVSFEEAGGSEVADVTVINGKTVEKPADPAREGYGFIGWYMDAELTMPYLFSTQIITGDTTLYAGWGKKLPGASEYAVNFVTGTADVAAPAAKETTGGVVYNLPTVEREGYTFEGWWISDTNDAEKLTCRYQDGMVLTQNTTLFAVWTQAATDGKLDAPIVEVTGTSVSWNGVKNALNYYVEITGLEGFTLVEQTIGGTNMQVDFANAPEGEYLVKVTARAASAANNSETTVRYFTNKALSRVSHFTVVEPSVINFEGVENAENYFITIVCGNEQHEHTMLNNGASTNYSFLNCEMKEGGIEFVITAVAEGYVASTSQTFTYERSLNAVEGLHLDEKTQTLVWDAVPQATNYMVSVRCGNAAHDHALVDNGSKTSYSLKECEPCEGGINVEVYPVTKGYNTPAPTSFNYDKKSLATPSDLRIVGNVLTWAAVNNAEGYEVKIGDKTFETKDASFDLTDKVTLVEAQKYTISVRAKGAENSLWSDAIDARYLVLANSLKYTDGVVSWQPVIGADFYEVTVNGDIEAAKIVLDGSTSLAVSLTKAGVNEISVRFFGDETYSNDVTLKVVAYTVEFDTRLGEGVEKQYKALGDSIELPVTTKAGYVFDGWYNAPGGAAANAAKYTDAKVTQVGDMVLYAGWVPAKFVVTYNRGGSLGSSENLTTTVTYGSAFSFAVPEKEEGREDLVFAGWYKSSEIKDENKLTNENGEGLGVWDIPNDCMVYAYWRDTVYEFVEYGAGYAVQKGPDIGKMEILNIPQTYQGKPVVRIEAYAFKYCSNLKEVNIPNSIQEIELTSFYQCSNLAKINVIEVEGVVEPLYYSLDGILIKDNKTTGQQELMTVPAKLTGDVTIPEGVTEIPSTTFKKSLIRSIVLPSTVEAIQYQAFYDCPNLQEVTVLDPASEPQNLMIASEAFEKCPVLAKVTLPARTNALGGLEVTGDTVTGNLTIFKNCESLASIVLPARVNMPVQTIEGTLCCGSTLIYCPFGKTSETGEYTIPEGINTIAANAFANCHKITKLIIPNYVRTIGANAFNGMAVLTDVVFEGDGAVNVGVGEGAFANCANLTTVSFTGECRVTSLGASAFADCKKLTNFVVPDSVTAIGNKAFENCLGLTTMNIPVGVEAIALGAFAGCDNIEGITVATGNVNYVDDKGALYEKDTTNNVTYNKIIFYSKKKGNVTLPAETTTIGDGVFANNENITTFTIGVNVTTVGANAFDGCVNLAEVIFTPVTPAADGTVARTLTLGNYAFANCTALTEFEFPKHAKKTGNYVLYKSTNVAEVTFLNDATTIGSYALAYTAISEISLPATLTTIPSGLFQGCKNITQITLPSKLTEIGAKAFQNAGLTALELPSTVTTIGANAFENAKVSSVALPEGLTTLGASAFQGSALTNIAIPASVNSIGTYAFADTKNLVSASIADTTSLTTIPEYMFSESAVKSFNVPGSITTIGARSFYRGAIEQLTFSEGTADLKINENVFYYAALTTVTFPDRLVEVGNYSFYACESLTTVNISETSRLKKLGNSAFALCEELEYFFIPKTVMNTSKTPGAAYNGRSLGTYLFMSNDNLKTVEFQAGGVIDKANGLNGVSFSDNMFLGCTGLETLILPDHLDAYSASVGPFTDSTFATHPKLTITVRESVLNYKMSADGVLYSLDETKLIKCPASNRGNNGVITVPATVTSIEAKAFAKCTEITKIVFEDSTESLTIGNYAFDACTNLTDFTLPTRVTSVGTYAFRDCVFFGEEAFDLNDYPNWTKISNYTFQNSNIQGVIFSPSITEIGLTAFSGCEQLTEVDFTQATALTNIKGSAFKDCTALEAVEIPASVTEIGYTAFKGCTALASITFAPNSQLKKLTGSSGETFGGTAITSIVLPDSLEDVTYSSIASGTRTGVGQFNNCPNLTSITISKNLKADKAIGLLTGANNLQEVIAPEGCVNFTSENGVLYSRNGETLVWYPAKKLGSTYTVKDGVTTIADNAFINNLYLTKVNLPATVTSIGVFAFMKATALTELEIPAGVTAIPNDMALNCTALKSVKLMGDVTTIGNYAFRNCGNLQTINLPATVESIGDYAFEYCSKMADVKLTESLVYLGEYAFSWCTSFKELIIPKTAKPTDVSSSSKPYGNSPFGGLSHTDIIIDPANPYFYVEDGFIYNPDKTVLMYVSNTISGEVVIPASVTQIDTGAFGNCENITDVICGKALETIDLYAFENSSIRSITLNSAVKLQKAAFRDCSNLEEVKGVAPTAGQSNIFENCTSLEEITLAASSGLYSRVFAGCTSLKKVEVAGAIVENLTYAMVYEDTFEGCTSLESLTIYPLTRKCEDEKPFANLPSTCTLYLKGVERVEDWDPAISKLYLDGFKGQVVCLG